MKKVMKNTPVQVLLDKIGIQKAAGEGPTPTPEVIAQSIGVKIKQGNLVLGRPNDPWYTWFTTYRKNDGKVYQLSDLAGYIDEMPDLQEYAYEIMPDLPRDLGGLWFPIEDETHAIHCNMTADELWEAIDENDNIAIFNACDKVYDSEDNALYDIVDVNPHTSVFGIEYGRFVAAATGESFTWEGEEYKVMMAHNIYSNHEDTTALLYGRIEWVDYKGDYYVLTYYMKDGELVPFQTKPAFDDQMNYNHVWTTDGVVDEYISYWANMENMGNVIPCPNATPENPSYGYNINSQIVYRVGISDDVFPICTLETRSAIVGGNVNLYGYPIGVIETVEGAQGDADANAGADTATGPIVVQISVDGKEWTTIGKTLDDDTNVITNIPRGLFLKFSEDVNITEG